MRWRERVLGAVVGRVLQRLSRGRVVARVAPELRFAGLVVETAELTVPTGAGPALTTVYRPAAAADGGAPAVHVNFHGGGFVMGDHDQDDAWCRYLAVHAGVVVLNVDYVLAPQHPFPAAVHQAHDVVAWAAAHGAEHGWDGARLTVGGQSAGGALATAAARLALERHGPPVALQVLHYPPLDLATPAAAKRAGKRSPLISPPLAAVFNGAYAPDASVRTDPLASAVYSTVAQLRGIAPAVLVTCELDRLRDEGIRYADLLREAGALAAHHDVPGLDHAYNLFGGDLATVERMYAVLAGAVAAAHRRG